MGDWRDIAVQGVLDIDRVAAVFQVWAVSVLPYAKCKVKVLEHREGGYTGMPNIAARNPTDRAPQWVQGTGETVEQALEDTVRRLLASVQETQATAEGDFAYADPVHF